MMGKKEPTKRRRRIIRFCPRRGDASVRRFITERVIHQWHWATKAQRPSLGLGRPAGVNLIEGNRRDVIDFLDRLSYGDGSTQQIAARNEQWRAGWQQVKKQQAHWRATRRENG
jgi:hypothetical protein